MIFRILLDLASLISAKHRNNNASTLGTKCIMYISYGARFNWQQHHQGLNKKRIKNIFLSLTILTEWKKWLNLF